MRQTKKQEFFIILIACILSITIIGFSCGLNWKYCFQRASGCISSPMSFTISEQAAQRDQKLSLSTIIPTLVPMTDRIVDNHFPTWMDDKGAMYGYAPGTLSTIVKSTDYWTTWKSLFTIDTAKYGDIQNVFVTSTNRVIVTCEQGAVFTSDTDQMNPSLSFRFDGGFGSRLFGHSVYKDIVLIGAYGFKSDENYGNGPRQVYMSTDGGSTFTNILTRVVPNSDNQAHVHDVEYDPYSNRIWIAFGDNQNRQLLYSDDRGMSWRSVYSNPIDPKVPQFTQIIAFPDRVVFVTDSVPEGFWFWQRGSSEVKPQDICLFEKFADSEKMLGQFATRRWHVDNEDNPLCLVPFVRNPNVLSSHGVPRLFATSDGVAWSEIYRGPQKQGSNNYYGLLNIIGPNPSDPEHRIFGIWQDDKIYALFRANLQMPNNDTNDLIK